MAISTQYGQSPERFGHKDYYAAKEQGLSDLQILGWMNQNIDKIAGNNRPGGGGLYDEVAGGARQEQNDTFSGLEGQLNQQASQFQQQMQQVQDQMRQQQAAYEQQIQLMENAQRAYVPQSEAVAEETQDSQPQQTSAGGRRLSSLAIIEGLGTNANPLSGLQLA